MANGRYVKANEKFMSGTIDLTTDTIKISLIDTGTYTVDLTNHEFYSDLSGVVATSPALTGKSVTGGVFDAADPTFTAVTGASIEAYVVWKDTTVTTTSPLIAWVDTGITGAPFTPSGGDILLQLDNGANKIFKL